MALPIVQWGSLGRSGGIVSAYLKQVRKLDFGGAKRITVSFDPFNEGQGTGYTRDALGYLNQQKARATNPTCALRTVVLSDRAEPSIHVELTDGSEVLFKTQNLSTLEILQQMNVHVTSKAPKKEESTKAEPKTKAQKAALKKSKGGKR